MRKTNVKIGKEDTVMATPVEVDNKGIDSQDESKQLPLIEKCPLELVDPVIGQDQTSNSKQVDQQLTKRDEEKKGILQPHKDVPGDGSGQGESGSGAVDSLNHKLDSTDSESENTISAQDHTSTIPGTEKDEGPDDTEVPTTDVPSDPRVQNNGTNTGESTPVLDGTSTPPTPRSTPAKPSVFKKMASIQKINLNKDFLKNFVPSNTGSQPGVSTTPRPMANEKPKATSSVTKALKPMVRNRLSNMGGTSMQRQGSGSSTPKSGRGSSPNFGRPGSGSDVWSWRRQPAAQREYSEEELQKQGVHLTARLTASTGDDANKWADMDDDWSDEDVVEEPKELFEPQNPESHVEQSSAQIAPHLLESAALGRIVNKQEETIIVSKNERFADVTYDRRDTRSPDDNIHGQRQIYNAKIGKFENVEPLQSGRDQERHSRKNLEIMQRGQGRRGSSDGRRRDSLAKGEEARQSRGLHVDNRGYSPSTQRRTSLAERDSIGFHPHRRRDSFMSTSGVSDADRSVSNASPGVDSQTTTDQASPVVDLIALQKTEMAESRKRAMERRARDEEERLATAERARKKAAELAAIASGESSHGKSETPTASTAVSPHLPKASPVPLKASPLPLRASPLSAKASPVPTVIAPSIKTEDTQPLSRGARSNSGVWTADRDQEEIIRQDSPSKEEARRSAWGAIGSSQKGTTTSHKHQENGLFNNPNTLATLNHTIGGDARRGRNVPRPTRVPITPTNVPPSLQGWATFAGNLETRKAHDDERQQERNQERERIERERGTSSPRTTSLVDKWKRVEIKEPENAGDIAGRTVVSVLKSGYVEDSSGNLEVRDMPVHQKNRSGSTSPGMSTVLSADGTSPSTTSKSPALSASATALGIQTPTQPTLGENTPGSRDRSRFFPTPSSTTVVDISSRVVHSIQPTVPDKSAFPQSLFPSFEDLSKSPPTSTTTIPPLSSNSSSFGTQRLPFGQYGQGLTTSPGQSLTASPHIGGLTPRTAFSHTVPTMISAPSQPRYTAKLPSVEDFDTVLARLRESMEASALESAANEDMTEFTKSDSHDPQTQTRTESAPAADKRQYMKISALSQHRDLEISTRDLEEEPLPKPTVKVSLPKILYTSSRDMEPPIDMSTSRRPKISLPTHVISHTDTPDAKSRIRAIDNELLPTHPYHHYRPKPPQAFKIQFAPSLRPKGGVVPNLIKFDKADSPYVNFEAKPEALSLPAYAHDNELFYTHRDRPFERSKNKYHKSNKHQGPYRKHPKTDRGESSSGQSNKSVTAGPSRPLPEKK